MPLMTMRAYARYVGVDHRAIYDRIKNGSISQNALVSVEGKKHKMIDSEIADADFAARHSPQQKFAGDRTAQAHAQNEPVTNLSQESSVIDVSQTEAQNAQVDDDNPENLPDGPVQPDKKTIKAKSVLDKKVQPVKTVHVEEREIDGQKVETTVVPEDGDKFGRYRNAKTSTEEMRARKLELEVASLEGRLLDTEEVRNEIIKLTSETRETFLNMSARLAPVLCSITDPVEMENRLADEINIALENLARIKYVKQS